MRTRKGSQANRGQALEELLGYIHRQYQAAGKAMMTKVPTEFIPLRSGTGQVVGAKVERKSIVDYLGRYRGTPVAIEAKHTSGDRIALSRVEPHQTEWMNGWCSQPGAMGLVVVSFRMQRFFAVPWPFWWAAQQAWATNGRQRATTVEAYGWQWDTPQMASVSPEQLLPEWEFSQDYLEIADKIAEANRWVSIDDRIPNHCGQRVLLAGTNAFGQRASFAGFTGYNQRLQFSTHDRTIDIDKWHVTHWQPMPPPPALPRSTDEEVSRHVDSETKA